MSSRPLSEYVKDVLRADPNASPAKVHRLVKAAVAIDSPVAQVRRSDTDDILSWVKP